MLIEYIVRTGSGRSSAIGMLAFSEKYPGHYIVKLRPDQNLTMARRVAERILSTPEGCFYQILDYGRLTFLPSRVADYRLSTELYVINDWASSSRSEDTALIAPRFIEIPPEELTSPRPGASPRTSLWEHLDAD